MGFSEQLDNIYAIDTNMWNFKHYMSAYLVIGKEIALIDTGQPKQLEAVLASIKKTGYSPSEISYIFCDHCEHHDHAGNIAPILRLAPKASVYINAVGLRYLVDPIPALERHGGKELPWVTALRANMEPVPRDRIKLLKDGDVFDLGKGEKLTVYFAPGHQPSGLVLYEEKHKGLFINDLVGNCFLDADSHYPLSSGGSDFMKCIDSLKKLSNLPLEYVYMGHYGITDQTYSLIDKSIKNMERLLDMGKEYVRAGKADQISSKMLEMIEPEMQKLKSVRGEKYYEYATGNHQSRQSQIFAEYCKQKFS